MQRMALIGVDEPLRGAVFSRLHRVVPASVAEANLVVVASATQSASERLSSARSGQSWLVTSELCEQPDLLKEWEAAARAAQVTLAVANLERFRPSRQLIRQQLDSGRLGTPVLIRSHRWITSARFDFQAREWPLACLQDLDVATWLMSSQPTTLFATTSQTTDTKSPTTCVVHAGFSGDAMAQWDFTLWPNSGEPYESLTVLGSSGAAYSDDHDNRQLRFRGDQAEAVTASEGCRPWVNLLQQFVDAAEAQSDWSKSVSDWHGTLALSESIRQVLRSRQAVKEDR